MGHSDALTGCPAVGHVEWAIDVFGSGEGLDGHDAPAHVSRRETLRDGGDSRWSLDLLQPGGGSQAEVRVEGWRRDRFGTVVVTMSVADKAFELSASVSADDGRLVEPYIRPAAPGCDIEERLGDDFTPEHLAAVWRLARRCYDPLNEEWFERRLQTLNRWALAWQGDELAGFMANSEDAIDLGPLGTRHATLGALSCVDPSARRTGLMGIFRNRLAAIPGLPVEIVTPRWQTAASFPRVRRDWIVWPGPQVFDQVTAMSVPATPVQADFLERLAEHVGGKGVDTEHWVMHGVESGTSNANPTGIEPEIARLFEHVDQEAGDVLFGAAWTVDPPPEWHS